MKARTWLVLASACCSIAASAASFGDPDPTFTASLTHPFCADAIGATGDSTLYVGGYGLTVTKLHKNGTLDTAWGVSGQAALPGIPESGSLPVSPRGFLATADGGVIVVGIHRLVKYNRLGLLDASFGVGGVSDPIEHGSVIHSFALAADGSVFVLGGGYDQATAAFTRFAANGRRATSFGNGGAIVIDREGSEIFAWSVRDNVVEYGTFVRDGLGAPKPRLRFASAADRGPVKSPRLVPAAGSANWMSPTMQVMPDGSVLLATRRCASSGCAAMVLRYRPDGTVNPAFGGNSGRTLPPIEIEGRLISAAPVMLTVGQGGSITVIAHAFFTYGGFFGPSFASDHAFRVTPDGLLDASFPQGKVLGIGQFNQYLQIDDGRLLRIGSSAQCPQRLTSDRLRMNVAMVEYYNPRRQQYFITAEGMETGNLDAGLGQDPVVRTGWRWGGWLAAELPGAKSVCRFHGELPSGPGSHFFTLEGPECDLLKSLDAATPAGSAAWRFDGYAFSAAEPVDGTCPNNLTPIYRAYNRGKGGIPKHRYSVDRATYNSMIAQGWAPEGVRFCVPPESDPVSQ